MPVYKCIFEGEEYNVVRLPTSKHCWACGRKKPYINQYTLYNAKANIVLGVCKRGIDNTIEVSDSDPVIDDLIKMLSPRVVHEWVKSNRILGNRIPNHVLIKKPPPPTPKWRPTYFVWHNKTPDDFE